MSSLLLKITALISMIMDHIGYQEYSQVPLRLIGRISFPIFAFLLVQGFMHTKNVYKYMVLLLSFALIAEIPYNYLFYDRILYFDAQNILFTLFISLVALYTVKMLSIILKPIPYVIISCIAVFIFCIISKELHFSYSYTGVLTVMAFYICRRKSIWSYIILTLSLTLITSLGIFETMLTGGTPSLWQYRQFFRLFALIPIFLYNGKQGIPYRMKKLRTIVKYAFYASYPVHILILILFYK